MDIWKKTCGEGKKNKQTNGKKRAAIMKPSAWDCGACFWIFYRGNRNKKCSTSVWHLRRAIQMELSMLVLRVQYRRLHRWPCTTCWRPTERCLLHRCGGGGRGGGGRTMELETFVTIWHCLISSSLSFFVCLSQERDNVLCVAVSMKEVFHCFSKKEELPKGAFKLHLCSAERLMLSRMSCCRIVSNTHTLTNTVHCCYITHLTCLVTTMHSHTRAR